MEFHTSIILILGIGILGGTFGAVIFQHLHIPQVIGYIAAGLIIGESGFKIVTQTDIQNLSQFNFFALGIIGFLVGGELNFETLKKYGRQFSAILIGEGITAFLFVSISSAAVIYFVYPVFPVAIAAGIVFGAIASATDPASTMEVLWEYRSRGILTTTIIAIVALDDALAMTLYGLATSIARILTGDSASILQQLFVTFIELFGAVFTGLISGMLLIYVLKRNREKEKTLAFAIGVILLVIGIAIAAQMDVILGAMTLGATIANLAPQRSKELMALVKNSSAPIYVIFFVLVGAQLGLSKMPVWLWLIVVFYVIGRNIGKVLGAYTGAKISKAEPVVQKFTGFGLFPQGGVAVGLSIMAGQHLNEITFAGGISLGEAVIFTVTATTLIVQIIGPPMVKLAVKMAGETGKNITEEDIIVSWTVNNVLSGDLQFIKEGDSVASIFKLFSKRDNLMYPVIDHDGKIAGIITLEALKEVVAQWDTWEWLVAADVMSPMVETIPQSMPLKDAMNTIHLLNVEQIAVVNNEKECKPVGILDIRSIRRQVSEEIIRRQQVHPAARGDAQHVFSS
ncbi:MAG: CBS domain-containing protein [Fibrobacter sp.]|jgi:Kef-type K+ transport system membrane component KefB|nr:CBS domain-containing protein [Fibrobacter sp.]